LGICVPIISETNQQYFSRPVLEKEDVKRAHGLGEHGLYHICQLEAKPVIWKVLFEHCLCDIDSADFTQSFLLEIGEVIPTADKEEDMAVDEEPNQQKRTTQPSTPNRNPLTEEANESPLPTQKNKRQASSTPTTIRSSRLAAIKARGVPPPIQSPPRKATDPGTVLEPLGSK
jgi:hypothetical protein